MVAENDHIEDALEQPSQEQAASTLIKQARRNTRDFFAGQIASGMLADPRVTMSCFRERIEEVFDIADQMLAESIKRDVW